MSNNTNRTLMTETQVDKYANVNTQAGVLDAAITEVLDLDFSGGDVTLTDQEFAENVCFVTGADLAVARVLNTPASPNKKLFVVDNTDGTADCTVTNGTATAVLAAGENGLFYTNGSANHLLQVSGGGGGGGGGNPDQLDWKGSVRAATTANGTLASDFENGDSIDGVTLATNDRILIKNQTSGQENGIYIVQATGAPVRATDADAADEINAGMTCYVEEGTENSGQFFTLTTTGAIVVDTTVLDFEVMGEAPAPYDMGGAFGGGATNDEIIFQFLATRPFRILSTTPSQGLAGTAALAQTDYILAKNGSSFGTMRWAASGTVATMVSVTETDFAPGDELTLVTPSSADANIADLSFTIAGIRIGGS